MSQLIKAFVHDEAGATAIEYVLVAGFLSVMIIGGVTLVGAKLSERYVAIASAWP
jgi:pilus assembly protein Flp/PilA